MHQILLGSDMFWKTRKKSAMELCGYATKFSALSRRTLAILFQYKTPGDLYDHYSTSFHNLQRLKIPRYWLMCLGLLLESSETIGNAPYVFWGRSLLVTVQLQLSFLHHSFYPKICFQRWNWKGDVFSNPNWLGHASCLLRASLQQHISTRRMSDSGSATISILRRHNLFPLHLLERFILYNSQSLACAFFLKLSKSSDGSPMSSRHVCCHI